MQRDLTVIGMVWKCARGFLLSESVVRFVSVECV